MPGRNRLGIRCDDARAHRNVAAGKPGHPLPAARGERGSGRPIRAVGAIAGTRDRLDERRRHDERQVADRGDGGIVLDGGHLDRAPAAGSSQSLDPLTIVRGWLALPGRRPTAGRRTGRESTPRNRSPRGRPSGGRRRTAASLHLPARRPACFVLATSVTTASGRIAPASPPRPRSSISSSVASGGPASTMRSASRTASPGDVQARSTMSSALARPGPSPEGLHAAIVQSPASRRSERAIDPPIRPKPSSATLIGRVSQGGDEAGWLAPAAAASRTGIPRC